MAAFLASIAPVRTLTNADFTQRIDLSRRSRRAMTVGKEGRLEAGSTARRTAT
jgi:3-oxoacyl-[acyl-carrier-protein] synthase III